jgi:thiol:disulfide interchange protein DsbG
LGIDFSTLFVFFDPNCPYCAELWLTRINKLIMADVPATWIPIAYMDDSSLGKSAALLRHNDKISLRFNFENANTALHQGGIAPVEPNPSEKIDLEKARSIWESLGSGTPMMVWHSQSKNSPMIHIGLPPEKKLLEIINDISSPYLEKFK